MRARLRPRVVKAVEPTAGKNSHLKVVKTPGKVVKRGGAISGSGAIMVIAGNKRKGE